VIEIILSSEFLGEKFEWPLLTTVYKNSLKEGESYQDYILYDSTKENTNGLASLMVEMETKRMGANNVSNNPFGGNPMNNNMNNNMKMNKLEMLQTALELLQSMSSSIEQMYGVR
jgi:hypothetical protein